MASPQIRQTLLNHHSHARAALAALDQLDLALVGIGAGRIVPPLTPGDNFFTTAQVAQAKAGGAIGEVDLRFIDAEGELVENDFNELIIGVTPDQLRRAERRLGVAGGPSKYRAIRAALIGGWINILVTDSVTAQWLLQHRD